VTTPVRACPILMDGEPSLYLTGPAEELHALLDALPAELDHDMPWRSRSGLVQVWHAAAGASLEEVKDGLRRASDDARVDVIFAVEPRECTADAGHPCDAGGTDANGARIACARCAAYEAEIKREARREWRAMPLSKRAPERYEAELRDAGRGHLLRRSGT
jgi:hypothetical protein